MILPQSFRFFLIQSGCGLVFLFLADSRLAVLLAPSLAVLLAWFWHDGRWWLLIHALFLPLVLCALDLGIAPVWYLGVFLVLWLIFSPALTRRVPLYLTGSAALEILETHLPMQARVLDAGAGTGTVVRGLARLRPDLQLVGIEQALLPWCCGYLLRPSSVRWLKGDYAGLDFADYDVVYAFLSPAAMPGLWEKARGRMRPGSILISNTFAVPGVEADEEIELNDWKNGKLLIWRM